MEYLKTIFLYSEKSPLIFTQLFFWGFFAVVLAVYSIVYKKRTLRNTYLFIISIFFYYKTSGLFFFILLFSTVADYLIGHLIYRADGKFKKRLFVTLSVSINLGILCYFKYAYFFTEMFNNLFHTHFIPVNYFAMFTNMFAGSHFDISKILLPVGISFFTFQTISYAVDIYKGKIEPVRNILDFGFFVSFFPQLVSGPIVRASYFIPQIYKDYEVSRQDFGMAVFLILNGLIKKMFIADYIAVNFIDRIFANPLSYTGFEGLMALYGYSLQVYCDFSGYTDIAIGVAMLMGFRLPDNFNSPYKARNVGDFWKRWHMSLSSWLKDYLYIPMGGNRKGSLFTYIGLGIILTFIVFLSGWLELAYIFLASIAFFVILALLFRKFRNTINTNINLTITMLLGGLWHGASWQFVIWGGLNGIGLVIYKFWRKISPWEGKNNWAAHFWSIFITFNFITFTRIWFRSRTMDDSMNLLHQIGNDFNFAMIPDVLLSYNNIFFIMLLGFVVHWLPSAFKEKYRGWFIRTPLYVKVLAAVVVVFAIYQVMSAELQPFIYFQF